MELPLDLLLKVARPGYISPESALIQKLDALTKGPDVDEGDLAQAAEKSWSLDKGRAAT